MIFACENGRKIPKEDKIFGINARAKKMIQEKGRENVVNATIGALLDDDGNLIVLDSIYKAFKELEPNDFAEYAPINGLDSFREAVKKDAMGFYKPKCKLEVVATPGGTGAIRNTISNYSNYGDTILIADWFWAPYKTIAQEIGRDICTFEFLTEDGRFNAKAFVEKADEILEKQDRLVVILNTPAHNPTGYSLTLDDWYAVKKQFESVPKEKKIALLVDMAYIDFAGDEVEYRKFFPILEEMPENVLPILGYSLSKAYTMYGMRCGAMICMAKDAETAEEFRQVCTYSSRGSWSNCPRAPQVILSKIYADPELKKKIDEERTEYRSMLIRRGKAFEEEANKVGLRIVPFDTGFFASIPCDDPDELSAELEKEGIFLVPLAKGIRVSVASVSEKVIKTLPKKILDAMNRLK